MDLRIKVDHLSTHHLVETQHSCLKNWWRLRRQSISSLLLVSSLCDSWLRANQKTRQSSRHSVGVLLCHIFLHHFLKLNRNTGKRAVVPCSCMPNSEMKSSLSSTSFCICKYFHHETISCRPGRFTCLAPVPTRNNASKECSGSSAQETDLLGQVWKAIILLLHGISRENIKGSIQTEVKITN